MKKIASLIFLVLFIAPISYSQIGDMLKNKAADGVKQGAESGTSNAIDKGINNLFKKKSKKTNTDTTGSNSQTGNGSSQAGNVSPQTGSGSSSAGNGSSGSMGGGTLRTYSKYDFVPGEKVIAFTDFSKDEIGDFPDKWNTNGSGEIMKVDNYPGHWLNVTKEGNYIPSMVTALPDNFTMEYDALFIPTSTSKGINPPAFGFEIVSLLNKKDPFIYHVDKSAFIIDPYMQQLNINNAFKAGGHSTIDNSIKMDLDRHHVFFAHISVWRQKNRVRVYANENKVCDAPSILDPEVKYNTIRFATSFNNDGSQWLISNLKIAIGAPDTRNKLVTEGKFSTTGILFDVNSSVIKAASYGTLKQVAQVLQDNAELKVKIIGHTDSDGDGGANLALSKKRADAVRASLSKDFGIDEGRMQTDGKGATQPVAPNTTAEGKAGNRRVEFVKL